MSLSKNKTLLVNFTFLILAPVFLILSGCGKVASQLQDQSVVVNSNQGTNNQFTSKMNDKLGKIKDEKTAQDAINGFVEYAVSRAQTPSDKVIGSNSDGMTTQSVAQTAGISVASLKQLFSNAALVKAELKARKISTGLSTQSTDTTKTDVSPEEMAQIFQSSGDTDVSPEMVANARDAVRKAMPNVTADPNDPSMSPLESTIVAYTLKTGDDGSAPTASIPVNQDVSTVLPASIGTQSLRAQAFGLDDLIFWVVVTYVFVDMNHQMRTDKDIFGNPVGDYEWRLFTVGYGRKQGRWVQTKDYFTMQHLATAANTTAADFLVDFQTNSDLAGVFPNSGGIVVASGGESRTVPALPSGAKIITFPSEWLFQMRKGDIIFKKSDRDDVVTKFSFLTHSCIFYDLKDPKGRVFEAVNKGVNIYPLGENWGKTDSYYAVRRLSGFSSSRLAEAVENAVQIWGADKNGTPRTRYLPKREIPKGYQLIDVVRFYHDWSDKWNTDGMYCSKLVWWTFKDLVDLDSNTTYIKGTYKYILGDSNNRDGAGNYAFIGVSPDDIYNSRYLDYFYKLEKKGWN